MDGVSLVGGAFVAATIVCLIQYLRTRDRRQLLLATMFACQSQALSREWYDVWRDVFQAGVCAAGLGLALTLSLRLDAARRRALTIPPAPPEPAKTAAPVAPPSPGREPATESPGPEPPLSSAAPR